MSTPTKPRYAGFTKKQLVTCSNGQKAMLVFMEGKKQATIDTYYPSDAYREHIFRHASAILKIKQRQTIPVETRRNRVTGIINRLFNNIIAAGVMDPRLDDHWFADMLVIDWKTAKFS